jgi:hypothetical protein
MRESLNDDAELDDWELQKVHFSDSDNEDISELMNYSWFDELHAKYL